jgi:hypothetical protein
VATVGYPSNLKDIVLAEHSESEELSINPIGITFIHTIDIEIKHIVYSGIVIERPVYA